MGIHLNVKKSTISFYGLEQEFEELLKIIFPFKHIYFDGGSKYLVFS
jgi:hypothetical protein